MKAKLAALILSLFLFSLFLVAWAQEENQDEDTETQIVACELVEEQLEKTISTYETNKLEHSLTFQILYLRITTLAQQANILGYKTSDLYDDLDDLDELIEVFEQNFIVFIEDLDAAKDSSCGSEQVYARNLAAAQESLEDVEESVRDISYLYEEQIRENILNLEKIENE